MATHPIVLTGEESPLKNEFITEQKNLQAATGEMFAALNELSGFQQMYLQENEEFELEKFLASWQKFKNNTSSHQLTQEENLQWFQITGFLFQLTGEARFAEEMEKIAWNSFAGESQLFDSLVSPYIFTKNVDHIHINLFLPKEISYQHTLGGGVKIAQKTSFPESGSIRINFNMEIKRYIEVFVRIPVWAEGTSVTVKGVKYFAQPGQYCIIAKKWKEGDVIEIEFPHENLPDYLKRKV